MKISKFFIDLFLIIAIGLTWGASFMFTKIAAPVVGPIDLVTSRLLIAAAFVSSHIFKKTSLQGVSRSYKAFDYFWHI